MVEIGTADMDRIGTDWTGRSGMDGRFGQASEGFDGTGSVRQVWQGQEMRGEESIGVDWKRRRGEDSHGGDRMGKAGP